MSLRERAPRLVTVQSPSVASKEALAARQSLYLCIPFAECWLRLIAEELRHLSRARPRPRRDRAMALSCGAGGQPCSFCIRQMSCSKKDGTPQASKKNLSHFLGHLLSEEGAAPAHSLTRQPIEGQERAGPSRRRTSFVF